MRPRLLLSLLALPAATTLAAPEPFELRKGDMVAFVGGTDLVRIQQDARLEAALTERFRAVGPKFRDLAWDADTIYFQSTVDERWRREAFGGWKDQLKRVGATVVIAQFGKIESLEGKDRLTEFTKAYGELIDQWAADGRRVVLLGPCPPEWKGVNAEALPDYVKAIEELARQRDLFFVPCEPKDAVGSFIRGLTGRDEPTGNEFEKLRAAVHEKHRIWFDYWRPANWKCLFGDDSKRIFSNAAEGLPSFKEEWSTFPRLFEEAEVSLLEGKAWTPPEAPERTGSPEADAKKEIAAFTVPEGFEVTLFADESHGVANPLSVRWDTSGRMYVACSEVYPQVEPGVRPDDKVIALRDTNRDGRADESKIFARGLSIPTGMEAGHDTIYVGHGSELLALRDTNGDGVADERKILLSGFGNGDSHQTINTFVWGPGGDLWFCQGDGIESRAETPFGISTLFGSGVMRLQPHSLRLDGFLDGNMGPGNAWGVAFDDFGQSVVVDGAGGISYLTPATIPTKKRQRLPRIGRPGGYAGVECIGASTLPEEMQGHFLLGDYKKNQVSRFALRENGAGFKVAWRKPFLRSKHRNFRPIDVKVGPDGAVYVVDWYNPIICHQDDFYRHPARDKTHGRIWRVAPKEKTLPPPKLVTAPIPDLLKAVLSPERWTRLKARQVLRARGAKAVLPELRKWIAKAPDDLPSHQMLDLVSVLEWIDAPDRPLVERLLQSMDPRARAYAARLAGRWGDRLDGALDLLETAAADPHSRVRMEALLAAAAIPKPESALVAAVVAESERDSWINYVFTQAVHHLKPHWLPAFRRGQLDFGHRRKGLADVLGQADSKALRDEFRSLLGSGEVEGETRAGLARALLAVGNDDDLRYVLELKPRDANVLRALATRQPPGFDVAPILTEALKAGPSAVQAAVLELAAAWRVAQLLDPARKYASQDGTDPALRAAAITALGSIGDEGVTESLEAIVSNKDDPHRAVALAALLKIDPSRAARSGAGALQVANQPETIKNLFAASVARENGGRLLATELAKLDIDPKQGARLHQAWIATGLVEEDLSKLLDKLASVTAGGHQFSSRLVADLVTAGRKADPAKGRELFRSARAGCAACHKTAPDEAGVIGPDLSALGSGVPPERIVTEVLWPAKQVKDGYSLTRVTTSDGRILQGYLRDSRDEEILLMRDFATGLIHETPRNKVAKTEPLGSLMPPTAQSFTQPELADLFAYLFSLRGAEPR